MTNNERPIIVDLDFETVVGETARALHDEHLALIARIDVRDHFRIALRHDFRRYTLLQAWSPAKALDALQHDLTLGARLPVTFAIYELADGETAVFTHDRSDIVARVLARIAYLQRSPVAPAA